MPETLGTQIKRAFKWHWNLLFFGGAVAFGLISGLGSVVLPAALGLELGYLGFLGTNSRFQNVLRGISARDSQDRARRAEGEAKLGSILQSLSEDDSRRFLHLRMRCAELIKLRRAMEASPVGDSAGSFRAESLDRMMWLFLKLLHQKNGIETFLNTAQRSRMDFERSEAREQLEAAGKRAGEAATTSRLVDSIKAKLATIEDRIANHERAEDAYRLICAEVDKTEQKIIHVCEAGMTGQDVSDLSIQVDSISDTMKASEEQFLQPQLRSMLADDVAPPIISGAQMVGN